VSEASAAQSYFDPPDPEDHTFAITVEVDVTAVSEDEALEIIKVVMAHRLVNDWYVDDIRAYELEDDSGR